VSDRPLGDEVQLEGAQLRGLPFTRFVAPGLVAAAAVASLLSG
jgi:hypothetical protein